MKETRITITLKQSSMDKIVDIQKKILTAQHGSASKSRIASECIEQADEKKIVAKLKGE